MTAADLSAEEAARVAEFEAADAAPESFDPIAALRRVEALAEYWDDDSDARYSQHRIAKKTASRALRDALRPADVDGAR